MKELIEQKASELHDIYIKEAKRQGDVRHKDKYEDLTENIKDFDRVLARHCLLAELRAQLNVLKDLDKHALAYTNPSIDKNIKKEIKEFNRKIKELEK